MHTAPSGCRVPSNACLYAGLGGGYTFVDGVLKDKDGAWYVVPFDRVIRVDDNKVRIWVKAVEQGWALAFLLRNGEVRPRVGG